MKCSINIIVHFTQEHRSKTEDLVNAQRAERWTAVFRQSHRSVLSTDGQTSYIGAGLCRDGLGWDVNPRNIGT